MRKLCFFLSFLVAGCAHLAENRTDLNVSISGFQLDGKFYTSRQALSSAIRDKKIKRIHVVPDKGVSYDQVRDALLAVQDAGVHDIGMVGTVHDDE